jgi:putative ABC transport system ATP-binding protein
VRNVTKSYGSGGGSVLAIKGISVNVHCGEFVSIMGQSGSGKSTLLHILACLHRPTSGHYLLEGRDVGSLSDRELSRLRGSRIGMVFQRFNLLPGSTILDNVQVPLVYMRVVPTERRRRAVAVLRAMGLGDRTHHYPTQLSGGQLQRAAIARALITDPAILLADEPTGNLDSESGRSVMSIFKALHARGRTIIQVTHDPEKARYANRVLHVIDGGLARDELVVSPAGNAAAEVDLSYLPATGSPGAE